MVEKCLLHWVVSKRWDEDKLPEEWTEGLACLISKKGDKLELLIGKYFRFHESGRHRSPCEHRPHHHTSTDSDEIENKTGNGDTMKHDNILLKAKPGAIGL